MRTLALVLIVAALLMLCGCWVCTLNPLYSDQDSRPWFDASFVGTWVNPAGGCVLILAPNRAENPSYFHVTYSAPDSQSADCLVDPGKKVEFEARIVNIGAHQFLDVEPVTDGVCLQCWAMHAPYLLTLNADELSMIPMDYEWLHKGIQQKRFNIPVTEGERGSANEGYAAILLSTDDLRRFVAKYADDKGAFKPDEHYAYQKK